MNTIPGMSRRHYVQWQNEIMMKSMSDPRFLLFSGNTLGLQLKCKDLNNSQTAYHQAHFTIQGQQKKQQDSTCLIITIILAALIYPIVFVVCCDWWKRKVYSIHEIPYQAYENIKNIMLKPSMASFTLIVTDSNFDQDKARLICQVLIQSHIKEFTFINCAKDIDYKGTEFTDFEQNMKPIKQLGIKSKLTWYNKTIE